MLLIAASAARREFIVVCWLILDALPAPLPPLGDEDVAGLEAGLAAGFFAGAGAAGVVLAGAGVDLTGAGVDLVAAGAAGGEVVLTDGIWAV